MPVVEHSPTLPAHRFQPLPTPSSSWWPCGHHKLPQPKKNEMVSYLDHRESIDSRPKDTLQGLRNPESRITRAVCYANHVEKATLATSRSTKAMVGFGVSISTPPVVYIPPISSPSGWATHCPHACGTNSRHFACAGHGELGPPTTIVNPRMPSVDQLSLPPFIFGVGLALCQIGRFTLR